MVLDADGKREAAVRVADGEKQSAILAAEGARQSAILRAQGYAQALTEIAAAAQQIDSKTMSLQYLDALKSIANTPSTKLVVPVEFTSLIRPFVEHLGDASVTSTPAGTNGLAAR